MRALDWVADAASFSSTWVTASINPHVFVLQYEAGCCHIYFHPYINKTTLKRITLD
jgi:hypothetical protein